MKKLLLFDIDGTLITGHGIPKKVAIDVINRRFPDFKNGHNVSFNGMTDPLIIKEVLAANNYYVDINHPIISDLLNEFMIELDKHVNPESPPSLLPGITDFLEYCLNNEDVYIGLVTGNIMRGARIKLSAINIYKYFSIGAFGSDHWNRNELPPIAVSRAEKYFDQKFDPQNIWIIGDSPKDVECAKANGLKCLAVETGKISNQILAECGADFTVEDLSNLNYLKEILGI